MLEIIVNVLEFILVLDIIVNVLENIWTFDDIAAYSELFVIHI